MEDITIISDYPPSVNKEHSQNNTSLFSFIYFISKPMQTLERFKGDNITIIEILLDRDNL